MAAQLNLTAQQAYAIADSFAQASARVLDYRVTHRTSLTQDESDELEKCEDFLDHMVVMFRGYGIQLIGAQAEAALTELGDAIEAAKTAMAQIAKIKDAIRLAGTLVDLSVALMSKNPKAIVTAAQAVKNTAAACV